MMRTTPVLTSLALLAVAGCTTGHEPNQCESDLHVAVDGGATIRVHWDSGCQGDASPEPYRDRA
ncbi:MAG TPA: hypothetical protein VFT04_13075 [Gemmatimonadales bacterium]|nr:hypothetical protein [Gemmatimonadales bacterium]